MKRLSFVVLLAVAWLGATALAREQKVVYEHVGRPLFSFTLPDGWILDTDFGDEARAAGADTSAGPEIRIVEVMPGDGTKLWLGAWVVPRASTLDRGLEYVASLDGALFSEIAVSPPRETEIGGMKARALAGTAKREGEKVELAAVLFEARPGVIAVVLYVGLPDTWSKHRDELQRIVASVQPAR
jgi:hypothetical protein